MTAVKTPLVNVDPQVSADICNGDGSGPMRTARGSQGREAGSKMALLRTFFVDEPISWNVSRKTTKP